MTVELSASSAAWNNAKQYIARIAGRDSKYTFAREFIGKKSSSGTTAIVDEPGLYEICNIDKREDKQQVFRLAANAPDGTLVLLRLHSDNLDGESADALSLAISKRLDGGETIAAMIQVEQKPQYTGKFPWGYRLLTKSQAARVSVAVTVETATEQCWDVLQSLPEKEAKSVLKALRLRVSPRASETSEAAVRSLTQVQIGARVAGGSGEDRDTGRIISELNPPAGECDVVVAWDTGVQTPAKSSDLSLL